jgi:co-chaperonin GroES (HSP10)
MSYPTDEDLRARHEVLDSNKPFPIRPILGRIIIELEETKEVVSEAGIIARLDSAKAGKKNEGRDRIGKVVAIDAAFYSSPRNAPHLDGLQAPRPTLSPPDFGVGDRLFFASSWVGEPFEWEGKLYHVLEGEDAALLLSEDANLEAVTR